MVKNKEIKKKFSFKKGFFSFAMGVVLATMPFMLIGCSNGQDGQNGADGTKWHYGVEDPTSTFGALGDFYLETDDGDVWTKLVDGWTVISNIKGQPGQNGNSAYTYIAFASDANGTGFNTTHTEGLDYIGIVTSDIEIANLTKEIFTGKWIKFVGKDGKDGKNGKDGLTPYIGYDGYFWYGAERSEHKFIETMEESTAVNTIGLAGNQYLDNYAIEAGTPIALMNNFYPNINKTVFSSLSISSIQVYAETAGTLTISTASVADIVADGNVDLKNNTEQFTLTQGLNTITFESFYDIPETDTLVLGKPGDTASLVAYQGIEEEEVQGCFADLSEATDRPYKKTNNINDKLVVKVETGTYSTIREFIPGFADSIAANGAVWKDMVLEWGPYIYNDRELFENTTLEFLEGYVRTVTNLDENQYVTVAVIDNTGVSGVANVIKEYKCYARVEDLGDNTTVGRMLRLYPEEPIKVEANQTLEFTKTGDPLILGFKETGAVGAFAGFYCKGSWSQPSNGAHECLCINAYVRDVHSILPNDNIERLEVEELAALKEIENEILAQILNGKKLSILGDSISTYTGVSNDTSVNNTLGSNIIYYNSQMEQADTWWQQVVDETNMTLLVNNSWSGSSVTNARGSSSGGNSAIGEAYIGRATNLHDNTVANNEGSVNIDPDIIAVNMGTNDLIDGFDLFSGGQTAINEGFFTAIENGTPTSQSFAECYAKMIYNITQMYDAAYVFVFTIPEMSDTSSRNDLRLAYNTAIKAIAEHYGCSVVDLAETDINDYSTYCIDGIHPNENGMDIMTDTFIQALKDIYLTQE